MKKQEKLLYTHMEKCMQFMYNTHRERGGGGGGGHLCTVLLKPELDMEKYRNDVFEK